MNANIISSEANIINKRDFDNISQLLRSMLSNEYRTEFKRWRMHTKFDNQANLIGATTSK